MKAAASHHYAFHGLQARKQWGLFFRQNAGRLNTTFVEFEYAICKDNTRCVAH